MTSVAYSYIRFSHPDQAKGDSLRRQTEAAHDWCRRHKVTLDESTTLRDLGHSAYTGAHRKNPDRHALAGFLKLIEEGKIVKDSFLIIENLDRLSREDARPALRLWMDILDAGVSIVQLKPETIFRHDNTDMFDVMRAIMELGRGHGESAVKSMRCRAAWDQKRKQAKEGRVMTSMAPAWLEVRNGIFQLKPGASAAIKRIFELAVGGFGALAIVKKLESERFSPFGISGRWCRTYVLRILKDRRVLGELKLPDGNSIPDYYPVIIGEEQWAAARAGALRRRNKRVRFGKHLALFSGLIKDARDGGTYFETTRAERGKYSRVLMSLNSHRGHGRAFSFPVSTFEKAILSVLAEIDPREVTGFANEPDEAMRLAAELGQVEAKIAELEGELLRGDVAALARVLREQEAQRRELAEELAIARHKAIHPHCVGLFPPCPSPEDKETRHQCEAPKVQCEVEPREPIRIKLSPQKIIIEQQQPAFVPPPAVTAPQAAMVQQPMQQVAVQPQMVMMQQMTQPAMMPQYQPMMVQAVQPAVAAPRVIVGLDFFRLPIPFPRLFVMPAEPAQGAVMMPQQSPMMVAPQGYFQQPQMMVQQQPIMQHWAPAQAAAVQSNVSVPVQGTMTLPTTTLQTAPPINAAAGTAAQAAQQVEDFCKLIERMKAERERQGK